MSIWKYLQEDLIGERESDINTSAMVSDIINKLHEFIQDERYASVTSEYREYDDQYDSMVLEIPFKYFLGNDHILSPVVLKFHSQENGRWKRNKYQGAYSPKEKTINIFSPMGIHDEHDIVKTKTISPLFLPTLKHEIIHAINDAKYDGKSMGTNRKDYKMGTSSYYNDTDEIDAYIKQGIYSLDISGNDFTPDGKYSKFYSFLSDVKKEIDNFIDNISPKTLKSVTSRIYTYWDTMRDNAKNMSEDEEYMSSDKASVISALLSGSKLANDAINDHDGVDDIPQYKILMIKRDQAQKRYDSLFNSKGKIYPRFSREEVLKRKHELDDANKELVRYRG